MYILFIIVQVKVTSQMSTHTQHTPHYQLRKSKRRQRQRWFREQEQRRARQEVERDKKGRQPH